MIIDCVADLHGHFPTLEGGDLLIIAGDLTASDTGSQYWKFIQWMEKQNYRKKIVVGGNHDVSIEDGKYKIHIVEDFEYLCDSMYTFEGIKIWGTPWTPWFYGVNPACKAFMANETKLKEKFDLIPNHIDILVSHGPPKGFLDTVEQWHSHDGKLIHVGSESLKEAVERVQPLHHVFGHIHEHGGKRMTYKWMMDKRPDCQMYNVSYVDERYQPQNRVRRIEL